MTQNVHIRTNQNRFAITNFGKSFGQITEMFGQENRVGIDNVSNSFRMFVARIDLKLPFVSAVEAYPPDNLSVKRN